MPRLSDKATITNPVATDTVGGVRDTDNAVVQYSIPTILRCWTHIRLAGADARNKGFADHVCDGTADQDDLMNAVADLPATGGKIEMIGRFDFTAQANINKDHVVLHGHGLASEGTASGYGTVIVPAAAFPDSTYVVSFRLSAQTRPLRGCEFSRIAIIGSSNANVVNGLEFRSTRGLINRIRINNLTGSGLLVTGESGENMYETMVRHSWIRGCNVYGISGSGTDCHYLDCVIHSNGQAQVHGNQSSNHWTACHFSSGANNPAGQTSIKGVHITGASETKFTGCKWGGNSHLQNLVHLDGTTSGGQISFSNCNFEDGGAELANTYSQILIDRTGGNTWQVNIDNCVFKSPDSTPSYCIDWGNGAALLDCRIGNTKFPTEGTGKYPAFGNQVRLLMNGYGENVGDPNTTGNWLNNGEHGVIVRDTGTGTIYLATGASTWVALT